ncbi:uncharacterized protein [Oscarella lobularis]|uniref:uncharacterized protein isoform X2 n=1 Tax=Oscarella lobularis TaxID=121494 RepID=UPI003313B9A5
MLGGKFLFFGLVFDVLLFYVVGSHFRGGIITWKPDPVVARKVTFSFQLGWRRSSSFCNDTTISSSSLIGFGSWSCLSGCSANPVSTAQMHCTGYSVTEDWSQGENTFNYTFSTDGPFVIGFTGCCWISSLVVGRDGDWIVSTTIDLNVRRDTGKINSSPISATSPIIRLKQHCSYSLPIHTDDPDGDKVRCRWAVRTDSMNECGGVCNSLSGAILDEDPCVIHYKATTLGLHAVALTLEDFPNPAISSKPLSTVPLQFLLKIENTGSTCEAGISYTSDTLVQKECVAVELGKRFAARIGVVENTTKLADVLLVNPVGFTKSAILGSHPMRYVNAEWTPLQSQKGLNVFCFTAIDDIGNALEQRCVTIIVGALPPKLIQKSETPKNESANVDVFTRKFSITFDQEIRRPARSKYITVNSVDESGTVRVVAKLDTSSSSAVLVSNRTLTFYLYGNLNAGYLHPNSSHFVSMDRGSVVGLQACANSGVPFEGIQDKIAWSFTTGTPAIHPCEKDGRGTCQKYCDFRDNKYTCYCDKEEVLAPNEHTCIPKNGVSGCSNNCSGNGACIGPKVCNCRIGWEGDACQDPVCSHVAGCSGHGLCVSPDVCACDAGWGGPACSVDQCSIYRSCSSCTATVGCGWCDDLRRCVAGFGSGASSLSCPSWRYYDCRTVSASKTTTCSAHSKNVDCAGCQLVTPFKPSGPGSLQYCFDFRGSCDRYAECFTVGDCPSWNETACPLGRPTSVTSRKRRETNNKRVSNFNSIACRGKTKVDVREPRAKGQAVVEETVRLIADSGIFPNDHGLLRKIAWVESRDGTHSSTFRDPTSEAGVGIWQMDKTTFEDLRNNYLKRKKELVQKIISTFGIDLTSVSREDLYESLIAALYARVLLVRFPEAIPSDDKGQAKYWKDHYNTKSGKGTPEKFLNDMRNLPRADQGCIHGVPDPKNKCKCFCETGFRGENCDQPDCGCSCANGGVCLLAPDGSSNHNCVCRWRFQGRCCEIVPPGGARGDPHLRTIDGKSYDYFDIGVYWGCISRENEFGVQLAFFRHKGTSLVGGAALKFGTGVVTAVTHESPTGIPLLRLNGKEIKATPSLQFSVDDVRVVFSNETGFFVIFFQYENGITYTIETHYSPVLERQFMNVLLGPSSALEGKTSGLCGKMDGIQVNDFTGPDGAVYDDAIRFGDSWRIDAYELDSGTYWSYNSSNFNFSDVSGKEYIDPSHSPLYNISDHNVITEQDAEKICAKYGLSGSLLRSCRFDLVATGDETLAKNSGFQIGVCPNDCSNRGACINGTCFCYALWSGPDCSQGGCENCSSNSVCQNGFCQCKLGYVREKKRCVKANCVAVNNCTSPLHGLCISAGECLCSPGFTGSDCSQTTACTVSCSVHGVCGEGGGCVCDPNWSGDDCSVPNCNDLQNCSGHGLCTDATCRCNPGWSGSSCSLPSCVNVDDCSGNGECIASDQCLCYEGFALPNCSEPIACASLSNCSGNGVCLSNASCLCYEGYAGSSCEYPLCPSGCSNQGRCVEANFCECNRGWTGFSCNEPSCEEHNYCSGNGMCVDFDLCVCSENWTGPSCNVPDCPINGSSQKCFGHGICVGPGLCSCAPGYFGDYCQEGNPYEATCNSSWSVQRDLWINDYKSWTDAVSRCSPLDPQALNASTAASPVEQWNAMQRDYINSLELWLKIYSRSLGLPATVPIDDNLSLEQQWGSVLTFANKAYDSWYEHVGNSNGFSKPSLPSDVCQNSRVDDWNQHVFIGRYARENVLQ